MLTWECKFCHKLFELKSKWIKSSHLTRCLSFKLHIQQTLTKDNLINWYVDEKMSTVDIMKLVNLDSVSPVVRALNKNNIKLRNISESRQLERQRLKGFETNNLRYGVPHNLCKNHPSRIIWQARLLKEEGITNVFQRDSVKQKLIESCLSRYGVEHPGQLSRLGRKTYSKQHKRVIDILVAMNFCPLKELKLPFESSFRSYDVYVPIANLLIEINGNYWHANPKLYCANDRIMYGTSSFKLAHEIWTRDAIKQQHARTKGYRLHVFWESELKTMSDEALQNTLKTLVNTYEIRQN